MAGKPLFIFLLFFFGSLISIIAQRNNPTQIQEDIEELLYYKLLTDSTKTDKTGNFVPIPYPITDKNLGYGGILGIAYMQKNKKSTRENTPRTLSGITAGYTSAGSWLASAFHAQSMNNDKIRYNGLIGYADINVKFFLLENIDLITFPINTNLKFWITQHNLLFRLGNSKFFVGPQYRYMNLNSTIELKIDHPDYDDLVFYKNLKETISSVSLLGNYDSRDQILSPVTGYYTGFSIRKNATWLGATNDYHFGEVFAYAYFKITKGFYSILHFDTQFTGGKVPFYTKPYVKLRGVPAMRYQSDNVATMEIQFRVDLFKQISLVGFTGTGKAFTSFNQFSDTDWIYNYGTGIRYTLKKMMDLRFGVDVAWSNNDFGWNIALGTGL